MIDPRAIIDPTAELDSDVHVGPFSIIGANVQIDAGTWVGPHVVINGHTRIGKNNKIYQFASLGEAPQDKKHKTEDVTFLEIGDDNEIREYCTMNRGTVQGGGYTRIGDDNWIMAYTHFAHDCHVGSHTIFANNSSLAGHVTIGDHVILGGFSLVHQFCRMGEHSFSGAGSVIFQDVPPYVTVAGNRAKAYGINKEGLRRRNFDKETIQALYRAYKIIYRNNYTQDEAIEHLEALAQQYPAVHTYINFLRESQRGIVR